MWRFFVAIAKQEKLSGVRLRDYAEDLAVEEKLLNLSENLIKTIGKVQFPVWTQFISSI